MTVQAYSFTIKRTKQRIRIYYEDIPIRSELKRITESVRKPVRELVVDESNYLSWEEA